MAQLLSANWIPHVSKRQKARALHDASRPPRLARSRRSRASVLECGAPAPLSIATPQSPPLGIIQLQNVTPSSRPTKMCPSRQSHGLTRTLFRVFILGQIVTEISARQALDPMPLPALLDAGLLRMEPQGVRSIGRLSEFENLFCSSDFTRRETSRSIGRMEVLGFNSSAVCLSNFTVRRRNETVFDLGTGSGIQALLAARHAASVVGGDINARALNFAAFTAGLGLEDPEDRSAPCRGAAIWRCRGRVSASVCLQRGGRRDARGRDQGGGGSGSPGQSNRRTTPEMH